MLPDTAMTVSHSTAKVNDPGILELSVSGILELSVSGSGWVVSQTVHNNSIISATQRTLG